MAEPAPRHPHCPILKCTAFVLLILFALVSLSVLIFWATIRPKRLIYTVEAASVENFTLSKNHLDATLEFVIRAYNPNSKISMYYDYMEVSVAYNDQTIALREMRPFFQPHRNATRLNPSLSTKNVRLFDQVSKNLALQKISGKIGMHIWIKAKIRFKVVLWKSRDLTLRVSCSPVNVQISKTKSFDRTYCSVKL